MPNDISSRSLKQLHSAPIMWLAWLAAVLYCSWPLGYILNPAVGRHDLASQLEALHQPFNWLFIAMDILTGIVVAIAGMSQMSVRAKRVVFKWWVLGYVGFGFLTALAAAMPLNCNPEAHSCGPLLHNPLVLIHGIASIVSVVLLLLSTFGLGVSVYRRSDVGRVRWLFGGTLFAWFLFGCGYFYETASHISGNLLQYYFITICSLSVVLVIGTIEYLHFLDTNKLQPELSDG